MKEKKGNGGIGFFGVMFVLVLFFMIRGCEIEAHQNKVNHFCQEHKYDYGKEEVKSTLIRCYNFNNTNYIDFKYIDFRNHNFTQNTNLN